MKMEPNNTDEDSEISSDEHTLKVNRNLSKKYFLDTKMD